MVMWTNKRSLATLFTFVLSVDLYTVVVLLFCMRPQVGRLGELFITHSTLIWFFPHVCASIWASRACLVAHLMLSIVQTKAWLVWSVLCSLGNFSRQMSSHNLAQGIQTHLLHPFLVWNEWSDVCATPMGYSRPWDILGIEVSWLSESIWII